MKYIKFQPIIFFMFFVLLCSCNSEFSRYQKTDKNHLEWAHLVGKVKSVSRYYDGELADIHTYNKYGFTEEDVDYSDNEIIKKTTYTYNEFGKIAQEEIKDKICNKAFITKYDEQGNPIEEYEEIYEVYDKKSDVTIGKKLQYTYENKYDKFGGLISRKCFRRNGTCKLVMEYNQDGNLSKETEYNEEGSIVAYTDYSYRGDIIAVEKKTYPNSHLMYNVSYYDQNGNIEKRAKLYEDKSVNEIDEYILDDNGYVIKEISTWVVTIAYKPNLKIGDICHTITLYDRDNHGSIIKETRTTYYPNEDMSKPKEADITRRFQYKYDKHGNIIYEKNAENQEYKYEITYY